MTRLSASCAFLFALAAVGAAQEQAPAPFKDPAPPEVRTLEPRSLPDPVAPQGHKLHGAPRALAAEAVTEDWPSFLGPRRDSRSRETHLALDWPEAGPTLVWEIERGEGFAAPVVADGRVIYTHRQGDVTHIDALDATTGMQLWRYSVACEYQPRYVKNGGPRSAPLVDGERVFVHDVQGGLHCLELATGRLIWERDLSAEFNVQAGFFGVVSSPLVHDGLLIQIVGGKTGPSVAAFRVEDGGLAWGTGRKWLADCASPVLAVVDGRARVFALTGGESRPTTGGLMVMDAESGALELELPFRSRTFESVNASSPLMVGDSVFITASYNTGSAAAAPDGDGKWKELWRNRHVGIQFGNSIASDGMVYVIDGVSDRTGALVCIDPKTGELASRTDLVWEEEVELSSGKQTVGASVGEGSLLWVEEHFLCLGDTGQLVCAEATPKGAEIRSHASLFRAREAWTPPVLSHGLLYICQNSKQRKGGPPMRLLCYDLRGE